MGIRLVVEVLDNAPADLTPAERLVLVVIAEPTIPVKRAAAVLGISIRHAYAAAERGEIPTIKVGQRIVIPTARFLEKYELAPAMSASAA